MWRAALSRRAFSCRFRRRLKASNSFPGRIRKSGRPPAFPEDNVQPHPGRLPPSLRGRAGAGRPPEHGGSFQRADRDLSQPWRHPRERAFNPDDGTFLLVYRVGSPATIYGRYLDSDGMPIGTAFLIGTGGGGFGPSVAYSPSDGGRYLVTWEQLTSRNHQISRHRR